MAAPTPQKSSPNCFKLSHHAVERALHIEPRSRKGRERKCTNGSFGLVAVNILGAVASYATDATMTCWPSVPAIARDTGYSEPIVSHVLTECAKLGIFERTVRWKQSTIYSWIRSDSVGYTILSRKWWQRHADLGEGRGLFLILHAAADGRPFSLNVKKECVSKLGTSRATVYRLLLALKAKGMVATKPLNDATQFTVRVSQAAWFITSEVSQAAGFITPDVSQAADAVSQAASEVSQAAVLGVSATTVKVSTTKPEGFDFEVKAHKSEVPLAKPSERPVSHSSSFQTESESKPEAVSLIPAITPREPAMTAKRLGEWYRSCYEQKFGFACPWDDGDDKATVRTVAKLAGWGPDAFMRCLDNLFASKDGWSSKKPSLVLTKLHEYIGTPLNAYNRPLTMKDLTFDERFQYEFDECGRLVERQQEETETIPAESEPPEPEPADELTQLCVRLYGVSSTKSGKHAAFTGQYRAALGQLLLDWTPDAIVIAFKEYVRDADDFDMSHAPKRFVEGAARDILADLKERDRKAEEKAERQRAEAKVQAEKDRAKQIGHEILIDQELEASQKWDAIASDDERWADDDAVRDRAVARDRADAGGHADRAELWNLEQEAMAMPEFQAVLATRLSEPDEVRQERRRQRQEKQQIHREHRQAREREQRRRESKDREALVHREREEWGKSEQEHGVFGAFAA
jgi:hypothetical protein